MKGKNKAAPIAPPVRLDLKQLQAAQDAEMEAYNDLVDAHNRYEAARAAVAKCLSARLDSKPEGKHRGRPALESVKSREAAA